jgi:hypothetical protein
VESGRPGGVEFCTTPESRRRGLSATCGQASARQFALGKQVIEGIGGNGEHSRRFMGAQNIRAWLCFVRLYLCLVCIFLPSIRELFGNISRISKVKGEIIRIRNPNIPKHSRITGGSLAIGEISVIFINAAEVDSPHPRNSRRSARRRPGNGGRAGRSRSQ